MLILEGVKAYQELGLNGASATSAFCQDLILHAISKSSYLKNVTVKGGVAMRNFTKDTRRSTLDLDIDFMNLSISEDSIQRFVSDLSSEEFRFNINGKIEDLKQQDYHGKRVHIKITDSTNYSVVTKIDIGVHTYPDMKQDEVTINFSPEKEKIVIFSNSKEQIFAEKAKAFLRLGQFSTRYKDIFDMFWLQDFVSIELLKSYLETLVFKDPSMKENSSQDIHKRFEKIFSDKNFLHKLRTSNKNWVGEDIEKIKEKLLQFVKKI